MAQILMVLKQHELPSRGLVGGKTYEMVDSFTCKCGKQKVVSVLGGKGRIRPVGCLHCKAHAKKTPHGWFKAYRFVPLNDPGFLGDEVIEEQSNGVKARS